MKKRLILQISSFCIIFSLLTSSFLVSANTNEKGEKASADIIEDIIEYNLKKSGASTVENFINGELANKAGVSSEWYVIALSQYKKYDFSKYKTMLLEYLAKNEVGSAVTRQKYTLSLIAVGSADSYIYKTLNDSIGKQGIMSYVFGLHLLNNGYRSNDFSVSDLKKKLISFQLKDGGFAVMGQNGDVDVTAMVLQALSPYYKSDGAVNSSVNKALAFLQNAQKSDGNYASYGVNNPESTSQVLIALSMLGIDAKTDSRFIKNGNTLFDVIKSFKLSNGSFCHKSGGGENVLATVQVFCAMVSYLRMANGKGGFYILDNRNPSALVISTENHTGEKATAKQNTAVNNNNGATQKSSQKVSKKSAQSHYGSTQKVGDSDTVKQTENEAETKTAKAKNSTDKQKSDSKKKKSVQKAEQTTVKVKADEKNIGENEPETTEIVKSGKDKTSGNYKLWANLAVIISALIICAVLFAFKKRNFKNFIVIFLLALSGIAFITFTNFQTPDEYYNSAVNKENSIGTVTLSIRCDSIPDKSRADIPDNGIILDTKEFQLEKGDSVYDILKEAAKKNKIHLETSGGESSVYVEGIANIYEFDFGDLSGWIYRVNGIKPSVGCDEYELSDNDKIEWLYTCNLGEDIE